MGTTGTRHQILWPTTHLINHKATGVNHEIIFTHQIIFGLVSFDTDQGQIHVEVTVQPATEAELAMPQALMIKEAKRKLRLGNKLPTEVISMTVHDMLMSRVA